MKRAVVAAEARLSLEFVLMLMLKARELEGRWRTRLFFDNGKKEAVPVTEVVSILRLCNLRNPELWISSKDEVSPEAEADLAAFVERDFKNLVWDVETGAFSDKKTQSDGELPLLLGLLGDGVCLLDAAATITHVNEAYSNMIDRSLQAGSSLAHTCLGEMVKQVFASGQSIHTLIADRHTAAQITAALQPVLVNGQVTGVISVLKHSDTIQDLSETVRLVTEKSKKLEEKSKRDWENRWYPERYVSETPEQKIVRTLKPGTAFQAFVGMHHTILEALALAGKAAQVQSTVLITGKSGTGKELVAEGIHHAGPRSPHTLVKVNCAAIPEALLESELFGHEKGAFTGAIKRKLGKFELADKGTLFLDEIGEMGLEMQTKLLRVLQNSTFERVGGETTLQVDVRIVAATNRDLEQMVNEGKFREDLYYRLNVIPIHLSQLCERKTDIPLLVNYFLKRFNQHLGRDVKGISQMAMDALVQYGWPGNVRELKNIIERVVVLTDEEYIDICDLPPCFHQGNRCEPEETRFYGSISKEEIFPLEKYEKDIIRAALERYGSYSAAAKALGITHKTVAAKARKYGLLDWINHWTLL